MKARSMVYHPFSHRPGHEVLVPFTSWKARVFPAALHLSCLLSCQEIKLSLGIKGPVVPFTVEQDLQEGCLILYGQSLEGYVRIKLAKKGQALVLSLEKTPLKGVAIEDRVYHSGESLCLVDGLIEGPAFSKERVFFGEHKLQDVDLIRRRSNLKEVLPLWHALGAMTPPGPLEGQGPTFDLLASCEEKVAKREVSTLYQDLLYVYWTGLSEGLVPRSRDEAFQGILPERDGGCPLSLLPRGARLIRSLLLQEQGGQLHLLPALPSDFVCGKAFFLQTLQGHEVYLEWTKHLMRTVCIRVQKEDTILCRFPREVKRFRLKKHGKDRGYKVETDQEIPVQKGDVLWMDRFEK